MRRITLTDYEKMIERGLKLHKKKNYAQEILWYNKIIKIQPNWSDAYFRKGRAFLKLLKYSEAIFWFDKSLGLSNTRGCLIAVGTLCGKGRALYLLDHYNEALFCYDKALEGLTIGNSMRSLNTGIINSVNFILTEKVRVLKKLVKREGVN